jgi:outer membrane immunogenic protein
MKNLTLTLSILFAFSALACAGSEYSGKEMKQAAPMPPPCPNWTGFYIGGFGGYKFGATDIDLDLLGDWSLIVPGAVPVLESRTTNLDASGAELGGVLGYNYQWNKWVFGLELAGGYLWLRDSEETGNFFITGNEYNLSTSLKTHYLVTVGPRVGYAFCKWLPYVTGGLAVGDIDFEQHLSAVDVGVEQGGSKNETQVGWMVGVGLQYAITNCWSARFQYQYVDLGSVSFDHTTTVSFLPGKSEASLREHNASFAIIYGF